MILYFRNNFLSDFSANMRKINRVEWIPISPYPNENIIIGHKSDFFIFSAMQWIIYNGQEIISFYSPFFKWVSKIVQQTLWLLVSDRKFWQFSSISTKKIRKKFFGQKKFERKNRKMAQNFENFQFLNFISTFFTIQLDWF